jgi:hypothetical protein
VFRRPAGAWTKEEEETAWAAVHGLKPVAREQSPPWGGRKSRDGRGRCRFPPLSVAFPVPGPCSRLPAVEPGSRRRCRLWPCPATRAQQAGRLNVARRCLWPSWSPVPGPWSPVPPFLLLAPVPGSRRSSCHSAIRNPQSSMPFPVPAVTMLAVGARGL